MYGIQLLSKITIPRNIPHMKTVGVILPYHVKWLNNFTYRIQYYWNKRSGPYWIQRVSFSAWVRMRKKKPVISNTGKFFCFNNNVSNLYNVQKLYLKTIHSNTNNASSIELLNRLSNKHKIVTENMHDSTYNTARHI